ncbi:oxidoreductase [Halomonas cupida]|uniref:Oxidoreductase n=1 Tax=Halomonas cupida TaxID=44933 RepID=A0A1M7CFY0_9GAMM|nr:molybdopterin-dependent oxidoreductase [Halomonas cupida]GEN25084.1 oxidoreductase [Halomonas cupida]SHL66133.1 hypothetical protein SAMN05660971_01078 [Halomonas cupida]
MAGRWIVVVFGLWGLGTGWSHALEPPKGPVVLVVRGDITHTNVGDEAHFDRDMLESLPQREISTDLPWYDGPSHFSGPLTRELLELVGARGDELYVEALNDYAAQIPLIDVIDYDVILATSRNGRTLRIRDNGPLFVVYPFDDHPELCTDIYLTRSVWQVASIEVR